MEIMIGVLGVSIGILGVIMYQNYLVITYTTRQIKRIDVTGYHYHPAFDED